MQGYYRKGTSEIAFLDVADTGSRLYQYRCLQVNVYFQFFSFTRLPLGKINFVYACFLFCKDQSSGINVFRTDVRKLQSFKDFGKSDAKITIFQRRLTSLLEIRCFA